MHTAAAAVAAGFPLSQITVGAALRAAAEQAE